MNALEFALTVVVAILGVLGVLPPSLAGELETVTKLGVIKPTSPARAEFTLANDLTRPIRILEYQVSCSCLSLTELPKSIAPGAKIRVVCSMDTAGRHGRFNQSAYIKTDHPTKEILRLTMTGVIQAVWPDRNEVDFGTVANKSEPIREAVIFSSGYPSARIDGIKVRDPEVISVQVLPAVAHEKDRDQEIGALGRLVITWKGRGDKPGAFRTEIAIQTNVEDFREVRLAITAHIAGVSGLVPSKLLFGAINPTERMTRSFTVTLKDKSKWREYVLKPEHRFIEATIDPIESSETTLRVRVVLDPAGLKASGIQPGLLQGTLAAFYKDQPVFSIPYLGLVPGKDRVDGVANKPKPKTEK
jgi:hypothetical protein